MIMHKHRGFTLENEIVYGFPCIMHRSKIEGIEIVPSEIMVLITQLNSATFEYKEINPKSLARPTGHLDITGKEVYEGDVCEGKWAYVNKCVVVWDKKRAGFFLLPFKEDGNVGRAVYDKYYKIDTSFKVVGHMKEIK